MKPSRNDKIDALLGYLGIEEWIRVNPVALSEADDSASRSGLAQRSPGPEN